MRASTLLNAVLELPGVRVGEVAVVDGELRAFRKSELDELGRSTQSLMPVFDASRLSDAALEDLLAYLGTLRGAQANP